MSGAGACWLPSWSADAGLAGAASLRSVRVASPRMAAGLDADSCSAVEELEELHKKYADKGLKVIGCEPCAGVRG